MTLEEALIYSWDHGKYPDQFTPDMGLDLKLEKHPNLYIKPLYNPRRITIEISSYRGVSWAAVHFYAKIIADGLQVYEDKEGPDGKYKTYGVSGSIVNEFLDEHKDFLKGKEDLLDYKYIIEVNRIVSQDDIDNDPAHWQDFDFGTNTHKFNTAKEAEDQARGIIAARFLGDWDIKVKRDYYDC